MTVNYNFDLEDDDFFDSTFLSISENDLLTSTAVSKVVSSEQEFNKPLKENLKQDILQQQTINSISPVIKENCQRDDFKHNKLTFVPEELRGKDKQTPDLSPILDSSKDSSVINSRFIPGFTPKTKKRKFPGPAGIYSQQNKLQLLSTCDFDNSSTEKPEGDTEVLGISSSQLPADELLLPSWQNLQKDVSSCPAFLSTAKYYSIRRVLNETAKKKLPKHIEVPVLCVLIKKFKLEDSSLMFMDDTGEIPGKLDNKVLDAYKECIKTGTALILRKVTFLCNVLLLQEQTVASVYLEDGSVKHIHELNSILDKEEPLKPMSCECPGTPKVNESGAAAILKMCDAAINAAKKSPSSVSSSSCRTPCSNSNFTKQQRSSTPNNLSSSWTPLRSSKALDGTASIGNSSNVITSVKQTVSSPFFPRSKNRVENIDVSQKALGSPSNENTSGPVQSIQTNSIETDDLFCDGSGMDEFDELLCNLDEKSFLEEI